MAVTCQGKLVTDKTMYMIGLSRTRWCDHMVHFNSHVRQRESSDRSLAWYNKSRAESRTETLVHRVFQAAAKSYAECIPVERCA